jgi:hypothetical protein
MNESIIITVAASLTAGRLAAMIGGLLALTGAIAGGLARFGARDGRSKAAIALILGPLGMIVGVIVVATADGGLGTGNGLGGGVVAIVVGLIAITLGALARIRANAVARNLPRA